MGRWKPPSAAALSIVYIAAIPASASEVVPRPARSGLELATAAARAWAPDASLIYLENDDEVDEAGRSARWGYLFFAPSHGRARAYSVQGGAILTAANIDFKFEAPPVTESWIDSDEALAIAEREEGARYKRDHAGRLSTLLLMRGAFHEKDPDRTTWACVYSSSAAPSLIVVLDAASGEVVRTWRG